MALWLKFFFILTLVKLSDSYGGGAPASQCDSQLPGHTGTQASNEANPYTIQAVVDGDKATAQVTLSGSVPFKGILLQARDAANLAILSGTFVTEDPGFHQLSCPPNSKNALTHSNGNDKQSMTATWLPAPGFSGDVIFRTTVVKSFASYWPNLETSAVNIVSTATGGNQGSLAFYDDCDKTYGCFGSPDNCLATRSCDMVVKYTNKADGTLFTMMLKDATDGSYVAVGISNDEFMGGDSVVACMQTQTPTIKVGWNVIEDKGNELSATDDQQVLSEQAISLADGVLTCSFKHRHQWTTNQVSFDLVKNDYHLLLASGDTQGANELGFHEAYVASPIANFTAFAVKEDSNKASGSNEMFSGCGTEKGCFGVPDGCISDNNCKAFVSYKASEDNEQVQFEVMGQSDGYVAIGLSSDKKMGDDSAVACFSKNGRIVAHQVWTELSKTANFLDDPTIGLSATSGSSNDGVIKCSFNRKTLTVIEDTTFELNATKYFILLANGPLSGESLGNHLATKWISAAKLNLFAKTVSSASQNLMMKLHGTFMVIAWVGTASIGMIFARYFKEVWTSSQITGVKVWFFYHRSLMVLTWLLTVAAFIIIFVHVGGLSQVGSNPHPYLGIAATALCVIQPFLALFRCSPDDSKRPIFNWVHWFIGNSAQIIAIVAMFFADDLAAANLPKYFIWILIAFTIFNVLFQVIFQIVACVTDGRKKREVGSTNDMQMSSYGVAKISQASDEHQSKEVKGATNRKMILMVYVFFNIGFIAALVAIIWIS